MKIKQFLMITILTLSIAGTAALPAANNIKRLKVFEPLIGQWQSLSPDGSSYTESWILGTCGTLDGTAIMKNKTGKTVLSEILKIQLVDSFIVYIACVNKKPPVLFTLSKTNDTGQWKFVNPEHDFPQHIIYRMESPDLINVTVEGKQNGKWMKDVFQLKRVKR